MASRILLRPGFLGVAACSVLAAPFLLRPQTQLALSNVYGIKYRMDATSRPVSDYTRSARTPVVGDNGRVNPRIFRQVSAGSIIGLGSGVVIAFFSKPLALLIGLLVLGAQALESRGIRIIPYDRIQSTFKSVNVRGALQNNIAFKLSFGVTCALASFGSF